MPNLKLYTGNVKKQKDFADLGLSIPLCDGIVDIDEIMSDDPIEVIAYKVKEVPPFCLVDDTVVLINGKPVVDIKFQLDSIKEEKPYAVADMSFVVNLAYHDGKKIYVYSSIVDGLLIPSLQVEGEDVFGFDDVFVPNGQGELNSSYHQLKTENPELWLKYNPRARAIDNLHGKVRTKVIDLEEIPEWKGEYQN